MSSLALFLLIALAACAKPTSSLSLEGNVRELLFRDYDSGAIPKPNSSHTVVVTVSTQLIQIVEVEVLTQRITMSVWMSFVWHDERLKWNTAAHPLRYIRPRVKEIWIPDVTVYNCLANLEHMITDERAMVMHTGDVFLAFSLMVVVPCDFDVVAFPFDRQRCSMKIGSWTYNSNDLRLNASSTNLSSIYFMNNSAWELTKTEGRWTTEAYQTLDYMESFDHIYYSLSIKRKPVYFLWNLVSPCLSLLFIGCMSYFLPPDGERLNLTITTLLAFTVFLQLVPDILPPQSESIPAIAQLFGFSVVLLTFSTSGSILVMFIDRKGASGHRASRMLRWLLLLPSVKLGLLTRSKLAAGLVRARAELRSRGPEEKEGAEAEAELRGRGPEEKEGAEAEADAEVWRLEWSLMATGFDNLCMFIFFSGCAINIFNFVF